jgi:hypothetical protein
MARGAISLTRPELLRRFPLHILYAIVTGAVTGALLYWGGNLIQPTGILRYVIMMALGAVFVNGATIPVALPGRHWSFAFVIALMMIMLLVAGVILPAMIPFSHSRLSDGTILDRVNLVTWIGILTGGGLGLFYGVVAGHKWSIIVGGAMGAVAGFILGIVSLNFISAAPGSVDEWRYFSAPHFAWQCAAFMVLLHAGALGGAILGATGGLNAPAPKMQSKPAASDQKRQQSK